MFGIVVVSIVLRSKAVSYSIIGSAEFFYMHWFQNNSFLYFDWSVGINNNNGHLVGKLVSGT